MTAAETDGGLLSASLGARSNRLSLVYRTDFPSSHTTSRCQLFAGDCFNSRPISRCRREARPVSARILPATRVRRDWCPEGVVAYQEGHTGRDLSVVSDRSAVQSSDEGIVLRGAA